MPAETAFQIAVGVVGSLLGSMCALAYFRRVRLERPAVGTFNGRDLVVLACFIVALPVPYLLVGATVLTGFLVVTFLAVLEMAKQRMLKITQEKVFHRIVISSCVSEDESPPPQTQENIHGTE